MQQQHRKAAPPPATPADTWNIQLAAYRAAWQRCNGIGRSANFTDEENDRLTDALDVELETLMAIPAPDDAALAEKLSIVASEEMFSYDGGALALSVIEEARARLLPPAGEPEREAANG